YRIRRADPLVRLAYARAYRLALRLFFGLRVRDPDCACKLFRRAALEGIRLESGGAFLSAELLIKLRQRGRRLIEVGVPHHPRTAGAASGANPKVVLRAVRDFWRLRLRLWFRRRDALGRGEPLLG
ncbi:MAG TPA: glycosyltransferase family 2 protein, partial [Candidatus Limnocylindria bacterium]|nr:glycosyltransferase family 2 protein [Candidatus Limnocylindria bacterium]